MNSKEDFLKEFQVWRSKNGYPKRDECREILRKYKENVKDGSVWVDVLDHISQQEKPSVFLDSLFKKGNSVCDSDPKSEVKTDIEVKKTDEDYKFEIMKAFYEYLKENKSIPSFKILNSILGYKANRYFLDEKTHI